MFLFPQLPESVQLFTCLEANCTLGREGLFGPGSVLCTMSNLYSLHPRSPAASFISQTRKKHSKSLDSYLNSFEVLSIKDE